MADQDAHEEQPRRSSSKDSKRPCGGDDKGEKKRRKGVTSVQASVSRDPSVQGETDVGCSGLSNKSVECESATSDKLDKLTSLLSGLIEKLGSNAQGPSMSTTPSLGSYHEMSSSDEDCGVIESDVFDADPLDDLNTTSPAQPSVQTVG